jgi:hypothetical protein
MMKPSAVWVVDRVTVPSMMPVPVPSTVSSVLQLASFLPFWASMYVSVPFGSPFAARPLVLTL